MERACDADGQHAHDEPAPLTRSRLECKVLLEHHLSNRMRSRWIWLDEDGRQQRQQQQQQLQQWHKVVGVEANRLTASRRGEWDHFVQFSLRNKKQFLFESRKHLSSWMWHGYCLPTWWLNTAAATGQVDANNTHVLFFFIWPTEFPIWISIRIVDSRSRESCCCCCCCC